jgi:hypothetical protein
MEPHDHIVVSVLGKFLLLFYNICVLSSCFLGMMIIVSYLLQCMLLFLKPRKAYKLALTKSRE